VIIGKLIPAGTGFVHGRFTETEKVLSDSSAMPQLPDDMPESLAGD